MGRQVFAPVNVYADPAYYRPQDRYFLNDIIKALWNDLDETARVQTYGEWIRGYRYVDRVEAADVVLLTMKWNFYCQHHQFDLVRSSVEQANLAGKPVVLFGEGDSPANVPFRNLHVFEMGGYRSRQQRYIAHGMPALIADPLQVHCSGNLRPRNKAARPVVGFCGQAGGSHWKGLGREAVRQGQRMAFALKATLKEPPPFETVSFRGRVLSAIEKQPGLDAHFIRRQKYRAGVKDRNDLRYGASRAAFINNILDSDYTVCMRGVGNFSVRFYETLALGRIPVFIDTDCLLPWQEQINYRDYCVWVDHDDINRAGEFILDFHNQIHPDDFAGLQIQCRAFWKDWLSIEGFYMHFSQQTINRNLPL